MKLAVARTLLLVRRSVCSQPCLFCKVWVSEETLAHLCVCYVLIPFFLLGPVRHTLGVFPLKDMLTPPPLSALLSPPAPLPL